MGKNKNIFITSTGTNIGKTYCTVEILKKMLHRKVLFNACLLYTSDAADE